MRVYLEGKLNIDDTGFLPAGLWFASKDHEFDYEVTEDCIMLDGWTIEGWSKDGEFSTRWKTVDLVYIKRDGDTTEYVETEEFTLDDFAKMVTEKDLRLVNMDAYFGADATVTVTGLTISDGNDYYEFPVERIDTIEFIG